MLHSAVRVQCEHATLRGAEQPCAEVVSVSRVLYCCGMRPRVHSIETGHRHDVDVVVHGTALIELLKIAEMLLIAVAIPVCNYSI